MANFDCKCVTGKDIHPGERPEAGSPGQLIGDEIQAPDPIRPVRPVLWRQV